MRQAESPYRTLRDVGVRDAVGGEATSRALAIGIELAAV